jgi:predicted transcriptional regulator
MLLPSEIEARSIIPAIRAILAWKLINEYGHREEDVAKALGITQAAVSNYARYARGDRRIIVRFSSNHDIMHMIDDIAANLVRSKVYTPYAMSKFIEICNFVRSSLIICEVHHNIECNIDEKICEECKVSLLNAHSI